MADRSSSQLKTVSNFLTIRSIILSQTSSINRKALIKCVVRCYSEKGQRCSGVSRRLVEVLGICYPQSAVPEKNEARSLVTVPRYSDKFFLDADDGDEDAVENDGDQDADTSVGQRKNKTKRVTRVELNKRARRKERLRAEAEAKKMENISKEIDSLPNIMDEIAKEDKEKEKRRIRRTVVKEERRKSGPPRLGRHKFEPAPVQVLLTEEISGSLRKLKGCCNLARDRFKSIEKRGILAPSKRISKHR